MNAKNSTGGPYFEDLRVGQKIEHGRGRILTDTDNIWFSLLTCNTNEIHFNKDYAKKNYGRSPFEGRLVVNFCLVFSIVLGLSVGDTSKNGIMLGLSDLSVLNPTFANDTLYSSSEVLSKRESKSHKTMGIVSVLTRGFKQGGIQVIEFKRTFMLRKRGSSWE